MSRLKMLLGRQFGIYEPDYLGDGAYVGKTDEGIALFTTNGVEVTRPVYLGTHEIKALKNYLERIEKNGV